MVSGIPVIETESSKAGECYVAVNGTDIKNYGEKTIQGYSDEGSGISAKVQVADVKNTLGSVINMNRAGNVVVFDGNDSYVTNKATGKKIRIYVEGYQYVFYMWVKVGYKPQVPMQVGAVNKSNRYGVLSVDDDDEGFKGQDIFE